jgi:transposase
MMGTQPSRQQPALFSYHIDLEHRLGAEHFLRKVSATLDLSFVIPTVRRRYGRSGNVSLDPRIIVKLLLLLFLYDIPSERELMEQIRVRLDFLWFLGFDLDTEIPNHSVLSKARARWGTQVFEQLFVQTVNQCVQAGLVDGRLLHIDSTMVKAQASKDSVVASCPELVAALRQAYQEQETKLQVLPLDNPESAATHAATLTAPEPAPVTAPAVQAAPAVAPAAAKEPAVNRAAPAQPSEPIQSASSATTPKLGLLPPPPAPSATHPSQRVEDTKKAGQKLPANRIHVSTTDPESELARSKNGVTELNYKDHRIVDDAHGVITAVAATTANVADGTQLPALYEQHRLMTGLKSALVTVAGDHHYGTANNYVFCAQAGIRAHLGEVSANLEERGKLPLSQFVYEPAQDRLRCPQGHYLVCHQNRLQEQAKVYLIEDAAACGNCALREQCTKSKRGRSIQRHQQAELVAAARAEANSPAGRYSRQRRQHVMEGSFADAVNNHGAKKARWRGLWRQQIQSWLIAAVQNLRVLLRHQVSGPAKALAAARVRAAGQNAIVSVLGRMAQSRGLWGLSRWYFPAPDHAKTLRFVIAATGAITMGRPGFQKRALGQHARKEALINSCLTPEAPSAQTTDQRQSGNEAHRSDFVNGRGRDA